MVKLYKRDKEIATPRELRPEERRVFAYHEVEWSPRNKPLCPRHKQPMLPSKYERGHWFCPKKDNLSRDLKGYCEFQVVVKLPGESKAASENYVQEKKLR